MLLCNGGCRRSARIPRIPLPTKRQTAPKCATIDRFSCANACRHGVVVKGWRSLCRPLPRHGGSGSVSLKRWSRKCKCGSSRIAAFRAAVVVHPQVIPTLAAQLPCASGTTCGPTAIHRQSSRRRRAGDGERHGDRGYDTHDEASITAPQSWSRNGVLCPDALLKRTVNLSGSDKRRIDYGRPDAQAQRESPFLALSLCLPGVACWSLYMMMEVARSVPSVPINYAAFMFLWLLSIIAAVVSLVVYGAHPLRPQPWYVILNLFVNICGLIASVLALLAFC